MLKNDRWIIEQAASDTGRDMLSAWQRITPPQED